jgi:hypothetical protein
MESHSIKISRRTRNYLTLSRFSDSRVISSTLGGSIARRERRGDHRGILYASKLPSRKAF